MVLHLGAASLWVQENLKNESPTIHGTNGVFTYMDGWSLW